MPIKILAAGQSNMIGKPSINPPDFAAVSSSVRVWNNVNPLGAVGSAFVTAAVARAGGTFQHTDRNTLSPWFADRLARARFEDVDLTVVARGASPISAWAPGSATGMLEHTLAVWAATGQEPADVLLWHQGEDNIASDQATYQAAFETLLANLIAADVLSATGLVLIGGIAESSQARAAFNRQALRPLAARAGRGYAHSTGLVTFDATDNAHFDSPSLTALGARRYYAAYLLASGTEGAITAPVVVTPPVTPSAPTYRYFRLYITASNGNVFSTIHEAEFRATVGGADLTTPATPATASSSHPVLPPSAMLDNNPTATAWGTDGIAAASVGVPHWVRVDLGVPTAVAEIALTPPTAAYLDRAPKDFQIQGSNDDSTWTTTKSYSNVTTWAELTPMAFATS